MNVQLLEVIQFDALILSYFLVCATQLGICFIVMHQCQH
jgi:hypothetical protein